MSDRSGAPQIWKMPADGGDAVQVTRSGGCHPLESPDGTRVIYARRSKGRGIWSVPVNGGAETLLLEAPRYNYWDLADDGVYFVDLGEDNERLREETEETSFPVKRFCLRTGETSTVATIVGRFRLGQRSFSVARDGRSIAWTVSRTQNADLMLIRDFR